MKLVKSKHRVAEHGEVFTPPWMVEAMLDLVKDETERIDSRFLEPACGSGNFLVQIVWRKLAAVQHERSGWFYTAWPQSGYIDVHCQPLQRQSVHAARVRQPDARHYRGEDLETHAYAFIHTDDIKARVVELFGGDMQFDVIIGNPPYQLSDDGFGTSAAPIYQHFVEQAKALEPRYLSMVIPARWFAGGKGLDEFRESMLTDNCVRSIDDFLSASDVFPGVGLKGGVCYFLWDRDNPGLCRVSTHFKDEIPSTATRPLLEEGLDVFVRFNEGLSILKKVVAVESGQAQSLSLPKSKRFEQMVSSRKPFGLETKFKGKPAKRAGDILVYQNGGKGYIARSEITTGDHLIDKWKVYVGRAAPGTGNRDTYPHRIISTPFIGEPGTISSETYLCIGPLNSERQAESVLSYLSCRLTRLLILLHKPSQDTSRKVYSFVPTQKWTKRWTDEDLYSKYDISASEIAFIEKVVRPMGDEDD